MVKTFYSLAEVYVKDIAIIKIMFSLYFSIITKNIFSSIVDKIFKQIGHKPTKCLTYAPSNAANETLSPHNFILDDGSTLSFRTNKTGDKVAPRVVGQCGIDTFNAHFSDIAGKQIVDKQEIKKIVFDKIDLMLPHFIDYLLISDYTVWVYEASDSIYKYEIFDRSTIVDLTFSITKNVFAQKSRRYLLRA